MISRRGLITAPSLAALLSLTSVAHATTWVMVQEGHPLAYLEGQQTPDPSWTSLSYSDASWTSSSTGFGIGYGDGDDKTVLADMQNGYMTVYVRSAFTVGPELMSMQNVQLEARYDDGFVAYLNGVEIGRASMPAGSPLATTAASSHEVTDGVATFSIQPSLLVQGDNVLAVEVHNSSLGSSDLSFIPVLSGYDTPPPAATITRGPLLQQLGRDSVLVVWETSQPAPTQVIFGTPGALTQTFEDLTEKTHHVVTLNGLKPGLAYAYQVQSASIPSGVGEFRTEAGMADPYRVVVLGDNRSNHANHRSVVEAIISEAPKIMLNTGDLVGNGDVSSDWDRFFEIEAELVRSVPLYPTLGNHEGSGTEYLSIFELPPNERYYSVRHAGALVVTLDLYGSAYGPTSAQFAWLRDTLASAAQTPGIRHIIVQLHHSPFSSGSHGSNSSVRTNMVPMFEEYGVDLVFSGHDHIYERSTVNGVKYVVTGGGGAPLYSVSGDWWTEVSASVLHYCLLDIEGPRLAFTAKQATGEIIDSFVLGDDVNECTGASDCEQRPHDDCSAGEDGAWACVHGGCIWNCALPEPVVPDAGPADAASDSSTLPDGAMADSSAGSDASSGVDAASQPVAAASADEGGCGCKMAGKTASWAHAGWLISLGALAWRRRRNFRGGLATSLWPR